MKTIESNLTTLSRYTAVINGGYTEWTSWGPCSQLLVEEVSKTDTEAVQIQCLRSMAKTVASWDRHVMLASATASRVEERKETGPVTRFYLPTKLRFHSQRQIETRGHNQRLS